MLKNLNGVIASDQLIDLASQDQAPHLTITIQKPGCTTSQLFDPSCTLPRQTGNHSNTLGRKGISLTLQLYMAKDR